MTEMLVESARAHRLDEQDVRDEIRRLFDVRSTSAARYGPQFSALWKSASRCVGGGKLLRPRLLLGAFGALSATGAHGRVFEAAAVRIAAAVEVLHYALLLHDDVIDGDLRRRGRLNLIGTLLEERRAASLAPETSRADPRDLHWARVGAILMGDLLLSDVHQVFAREPVPPHMRSLLLDLLDHTITESIVGEQLDVALSDGVVPSDLDAVLGMTRLKTATYTFELPLKAAAILAGSTRRIQEALGVVGGRLGFAFQLQDDLLSTFGDAAEHGKDAFSDLREGKETAIVAYARMTTEWRRIEPFFGDPALGVADALTARRLLRECGAEAFVRSLVADQLRAAGSALSSPGSGIPCALSGFLTRLMRTIEERQS